MTSGILSRRLLASASVLAMATGFLAAPTVPAVADSYMAGDFHNHTTCTDGTVSIETMITKSIQTFGLEWVASVDHGGTGTRDCRITIRNSTAPGPAPASFGKRRSAPR